MSVSLWPADLGRLYLELEVASRALEDALQSLKNGADRLRLRRAEAGFSQAMYTYLAALELLQARN